MPQELYSHPGAETRRIRVWSILPIAYPRSQNLYTGHPGPGVVWNALHRWGIVALSYATVKVRRLSEIRPHSI